MSATLIMFSPKCNHCGEMMARNANFCVECGKPFHANPEDNTRPPAEVRPIRPINDSIRLPAPAKISELVPIEDSGKLPNITKEGASDSWDKASVDVSIDRSAESFSSEKQDPSALSQSSESIDRSSLSMDLDGSLLPTERSKRPWLYAAGALAALVLFLAWPSSAPRQHPLLEVKAAEEEVIEEAASAPVFAPTSLSAEPLPANKTENPKVATPNARPTKTEPKATPIATPEPKANPAGPGVLGALQAKEATPEPAPTPEPAKAPEPKPEPKPEPSDNAANEAADVLN